MQRTLSIFLAIAAIGAVLALYASIVLETNDRSEHVPEATIAEPTPPRLDAPALEAEDPNSLGITARTVAPTGATTSTREPPPTTLEVLVFTPEGRPLEGARILAYSAPDRGYAFMDSRFGARRIGLGDETTDAAGRASFEVPPATEIDLLVTATGFATCRRRGARGDTTIRIDLEFDAVITGRIVDSVHGEPLRDALVELRPGRAGIEPWRGRPDETRTGADGWYRFERVTPGSVEVAATHARFSMGWAKELEVRSGEHVVCDLVLDAGSEIRGTVRDAETGAPIEGAVLSVDVIATHLDTVRTDAFGQYVYPAYPKHADQLSARAAGYASERRLVRSTRDGDAVDRLDFMLVRDRRATGRVVDAAGNPLAEVYVAAAATDFQGEGGRQRLDWNSTVTDALGEFGIAGIHPDSAPVLLLRKQGFATALFDFSPKDSPTFEFGTITLKPGVLVEVEVVDEHSEIREDLRVELVGANADRRRFAANATKNPLLDSYAATRSARSSGGLARFPDVAVGEFVARATIPGSHREVEHAFEVGPDARSVRVQLVVPRGLEIRGRVRASDGGAVPKVYVSIDPIDGQGTDADAECDGEGRFRASGLAAGRYRLSLYPYPSEADRRAGRSFDSVVRDNVILGLEEIEIVLPAKSDRTH